MGRLATFLDRCQEMTTFLRESGIGFPEAAEVQEEIEGTVDFMGQAGNKRTLACVRSHSSLCHFDGHRHLESSASLQFNTVYTSFVWYQT